jgi:hypothetical protein
MAKDKDIQRGRRSKRTRLHSSSSSSSPSPSSSSDYTSSSQSPDRDSRKSKHKRSTSRRRRESSHSHRKSRKSSRRSSHSGHGKDRREKSKKRSHRRRDDNWSDYSSKEEDNVTEKVLEPKEVVKSILDQFPAVASELHQVRFLTYLCFFMQILFPFRCFKDQDSGLMHMTDRTQLSKG